MVEVAFTELLPEILATAPGCPTPTIIREMRNATRELCEDANCYRFTVENDIIPADVADYEFSLPDNTVLVQPVELTINKLELTPTSVKLLVADYSDWRYETGIPGEYLRSMDQIDTIRLFPIPEATYSEFGLRGEVAIKPSRTATGVEEVFLDRFQDTIIHGTLGRLLIIPDKPWSNPTEAAAYITLFNQKKLKAESYANGDDMPKLRKTAYGGI